MRQAGRYMPSYQALRSKYSFEQLCLTPELAVAITLQPIHEFDVDAAILFSDILFPLRLFGIDLSFEPKPVLSGQNWKHLKAPKDPLAALNELFPGIYQATRELVASLDRPLIGFAGAPWTLAAFLMEHGASSSWDKAILSIQTDKAKLLSLIASLEDIIVAHLTLQIEAGCHAVQLFDSLSHLVPEEHLNDLIIKPMQRIHKRLPACPFIYYKSSKTLLPYLIQEPIALSFDETVDIVHIRNKVPTHIAIQGNLDPALLTSADLPTAVNRICTEMRLDHAFIFNLSRGIPPTTPVSTIHNLLDLIRAIT
jgi:uroporphyrinogen decarboxylase